MRVPGRRDPRPEDLSLSAGRLLLHDVAEAPQKLPHEGGTEELDDFRLQLVKVATFRVLVFEEIERNRKTVYREVGAEQGIADLWLLGAEDETILLPLVDEMARFDRHANLVRVQGLLKSASQVLQLVQGGIEIGALTFVDGLGNSMFQVFLRVVHLLLTFWFKSTVVICR